MKPSHLSILLPPLLAASLSLYAAPDDLLFDATVSSPWYKRLPDPDPLVFFSASLPYEWNDRLNRAADALNPHLRIGLRYRTVSLLDDERTLENAYLGSIVKLESQSDFNPLSWLFIEWRFSRTVGLRLGVEQARAKTLTGNTIVHSDGILDIQGPSLALHLRYPNASRLTPALALGAVYYAASFEHDPIWFNGFGGPTREEDYARWVAAGRPAWPNNGYRRTITPSDTYGLLLGGALECQLHRRLDLVLFLDSAIVKKVDITYETSFYGRVASRESAVFPMSYLSAGVGLIWSF
jgi:hypothetical protein